MNEGASSPFAVEAAGIDRRAKSRRRALRGIAISGGLVVALGLVFGLTLSTVVFGGVLLAGFGALVSFLTLLVVNARSRPRLAPRRLSIEGGALRLSTFAGAPAGSFALSDVTQGWFEEPNLVQLVTRSGETLVLQVSDAKEGERLLRIAGVTARERVLRVPLASAASQIPGGSVFGGGLLAACGGGLFFAAATLALFARDSVGNIDGARIGGFSILVTMATLLSLATYALAAALRRREVVVGTDGIAYQRSLRAEFIPYQAIAAVLTDTRGVRVLRKNGLSLLLPTRGFGGKPLPLARSATPPKTPAEAQRNALIDRIREAMESGGSHELAQVALDRLDRNGRSLAAWREELSKLLTAEGDYRRARISPDELGGVLVDPAAPAERRVAAAVALAAHERGEARRRVRIAVQACADEDLQRALESAAEGEIDEIALGRAASRRTVDQRG